MSQKFKNSDEILFITNWLNTSNKKMEVKKLFYACSIKDPIYRHIAAPNKALAAEIQNLNDLNRLSRIDKSISKKVYWISKNEHIKKYSKRDEKKFRKIVKFFFKRYKQFLKYQFKRKANSIEDRIREYRTSFLYISIFYYCRRITEIAVKIFSKCIWPVILILVYDIYLYFKRYQEYRRVKRNYKDACRKKNTSIYKNYLVALSKKEHKGL